MAAGSKKLPLLYSLRCCAGGSGASAQRICSGICPGATESSSVFFHRSHIRQRNGHSRFVRNSVATSTTRPFALGSGSTSQAYGRSGDTRLRGGRWATIQSSPSPSTPLPNKERGDFWTVCIKPLEDIAVGARLGRKQPGR